MPGPNPLVRVRDAHKYYSRGGERIDVLQGVNLEIPSGDFLALMGPSGSGKTTLLNLLGGIDAPSSGLIEVNGVKINDLGGSALSRWRSQNIGFVFQLYNLLPVLTALDNITLPLSIAGRRADPSWLSAVIEATGLAGRLDHRPAEMSGGQQQRVAIARALVTKPAVVFADEPTGNLDSRSGALVLDLLRRCVREFGRAVVMVTHDPVAASYADRVIFLADGALTRSVGQPTPQAVIDAMKLLSAGDLA
jgi:putative ABC transport system ATP-binding protein